MTTTQIDMDASVILKLLAESPRNKYVDREDVSRLSDLPPERVNDAVALLVNSGFAKWIQTFGTAPYDFNAVTITSSPTLPCIFCNTASLQGKRDESCMT